MAVHSASIRQLPDGYEVRTAICFARFRALPIEQAADDPADVTCRKCRNLLRPAEARDVVHFGHLEREPGTGRPIVSAICFRKPRAARLWIADWAGVTCQHCQSRHRGATLPPDPTVAQLRARDLWPFPPESHYHRPGRPDQVDKDLRS